MPLNLEAVGQVGQPLERTWTERDVLLYALGVGAGAEDPTGAELQFTTENSHDIELQVLPTFAVLMGAGFHGVDIGTFNPAMLVHGEQGITLHALLPTKGTLIATPTVTGIFDKGSGALVVGETSATDAASGELLFTSRMSAFIRGEGGFGGERGPAASSSAAAPAAPPVPERAPDHSVTQSTRTDQALLYRLSGDRNPLHSDPWFAAQAGFDRPILHGLCTYGFTGRALLATICDSDPARFRSMDARFSRPVLPGDTLTVEMWRLDDDATVLFRTQNQDGDTVIDRGVLTVS
jgi:acyl dehydratase